MKKTDGPLFRLIGNEEDLLQRRLRATVWCSRRGLDRMVKCSMGGFGTDDGGTDYANLSHRPRVSARSLGNDYRGSGLRALRRET